MMTKFIFSIIFIFLLFPISNIYSQEYTDTNPTLTVSLNSNNNFVYQDSEGYTVVIGLIENNDPLSFVTNVVIQANFYDAFSPNPLEVKEGSTTLKVIPPNSQSPFMIRSDNPNIDITEVSTKFLTFDTSESMKNSLSLSINDISINPISDSSDPVYTLSFSGMLRNGNSPISDVAVHLAFYDIFNRIIQISTIENIDIDINGLTSLKLIEEINSSSVGFLLFSESDKFYSTVVNVKIPPPEIYVKLVTISDVTVKDTLGKKLSEVHLGNVIQIESKTSIQFTENNIANETPYTYYIQIKENSSNPDTPPTIHYIDKFDGQFIGDRFELQSMNWTPEQKGLFFIETFVWDRNNVPLTTTGPLALILVN
jgi:hypothetical protein